MTYVDIDLRRDVLLALNKARVEMTVEEATDVLTQLIADIGGTAPNPIAPAYEEGIKSNIIHIGITKVSSNEARQSK